MSCDQSWDFSSRICFFFFFYLHLKTNKQLDLLQVTEVEVFLKSLFTIFNREKPFGCNRQTNSYNFETSSHPSLPSAVHPSFNPSSQGEEARNIPGESVMEEQFTDEDGNLVTRKVNVLAVLRHPSQLIHPRTLLSTLCSTFLPPHMLLPPTGDQKGGAPCGQCRGQEDKRRRNR